jgi:hypothetical protein
MTGSTGPHNAIIRECNAFALPVSAAYLVHILLELLIDLLAIAADEPIRLLVVAISKIMALASRLKVILAEPFGGVGAAVGLPVAARRKLALALGLEFAEA